MSEKEEQYIPGYNILPLDIQVDILKKLPPKSLIPCRCVSKQWKSLIDSPCFILSYGIRPTNRFILSCKYQSLIKLFSLIDNDNENCDAFAHQCLAPVDLPGLLLKKFIPRVVGSSHGLLCFNTYLQTTDKYGRIKIAVLWNPSIRRSVGIQLPRFQDWIARFERDYEDFSLYNNIVGFGVCPVTIDPTIVNIPYVRSKSDGRLRRVALVFTLTSGAWNILSTDLLLKSIKFLDHPQVVIDRFIYWAAYEGFWHYKLVSFDLTAKEFRVINLPDWLTFNYPRISNLRGSLVVLEQTTTPGPSCFLWMMTEGVTPSFTRLYTINQPVENLLGFRKTGEPIVERRVLVERRYVYIPHVYDPHSQELHRLWIDRDIYSLFMCSYMETLLLLDQSDGYIYSISN